MITTVQSRRSFVTGLTALVVAAPAVVRYGSIMPVRAVRGQTAEELINEIMRRLAGMDEWRGRLVRDWEEAASLLVPVRCLSNTYEKYWF